MSETIIVDSHGCVWADGSLLLCPAEQADRECECVEHGQPATALMLAAAISHAVKAYTPQVRSIMVPQSPTDATVMLRRGGGTSVDVEVSWDPETMDRPVARVVEHQPGYRLTSPAYRTDALWSAAARAHAGLTRGEQFRAAVS